MTVRRDSSYPMRVLRGYLTGGFILALGCLIGCAGLDDFSMWKMNFEVFREPPQPLEVVKTSKSGSERARALRALHEPMANGGSQKEQDVYLSVLKYSASNETQPLCRIAAIDTLRTYKDPRAVDGLKDAYYRASAFPPENATIIRCQALGALGETGAPTAIEILVNVLREPPSDGPDVDRQYKLDERIAAARALGNFKHYQATAALVDVLRKERDIALRRRAHESLIAATGKDIPPDAAQWDAFLQNPEKSNAPDYRQPVGQRVLELTGLK